MRACRQMASPCASGIAGTVHTLVHLLDGLQDRQAEIYAPQGLHGIIHMLFHQQAFLGRQGTGLVSSSCGRRIMPTWDRLAAVRSVDSSAGSSLPSQAARW